ncbi:uncharacterized protein BT62DRAFT_575640 [Guyanagaster necrorhizus]|uniref:Uncharacterized protein n=1 Tax=Guyanagaster necrorhizus TaxID=856835 RepID=A0A9P7VHH4_9AGAR|nr:uncharacterized protein BT62DRAFT_575640 [Guyanagaster necrorhizus MCA 3950]KAG7440687.1 hypothetical protein BT62DRAFT_575640 [Guyanagaster necrorhizus MCA 3950]
MAAELDIFTFTVVTATFAMTCQAYRHFPSPPWSCAVKRAATGLCRSCEGTDDVVNCQERLNHLFTMYVHITLYDIGMTGAYHWALIPTSGKRFTRSLKSYQINNPNRDSFCELAHIIEPNLASTDKFNCCVRLLSINLPISDIHAFMEEQNAERGETPLLSTHLQRGWTSAQWCIRILSELVESGF